ncbi:helix-turn-helix domain-containing protein [Comamonas resistens]|uniref:helix-turn-helix domain-containing protein n=1 Tax=Comamonas resistens TaxID=3046670 RepID=UPI00389925F4
MQAKTLRLRQIPCRSLIFTQAGNQLGISASAVSQQMRKLEVQLACVCCTAIAVRSR